MSDRRDPTWFKTTTTLQTGAIIQNAMLMLNVPANATYLTLGAVPPDSQPRLIGNIEHIMIHSGNSSVRNMDIAFFSGATGYELTGAADRYIDHESFIGTDFWAVAGVNVKHASRSGLKIPYQDRDGTKQFHIGIINRATTQIETKSIVLEFSWRGDRGEV